MLAILSLLSILAVVQSACDNGCSGHGQCTLHGVCKCYDNWGIGLSHLSGDCSERICPFELAWVDTPDKKGSRHKYAECANRGICNRESGECECFPGYEGKAVNALLVQTIALDMVVAYIFKIYHSVLLHKTYKRLISSNKMPRPSTTSNGIILRPEVASVILNMVMLTAPRDYVIKVLMSWMPDLT